MAKSPKPANVAASAVQSAMAEQASIRRRHDALMASVPAFTKFSDSLTGMDDGAKVTIEVTAGQLRAIKQAAETK